MRWPLRLLALWFVAVTAAPGVVFVGFQLRKAYVERELFVQRDVMEGMRTCHGDCFLSRQFKALEQEAERGFPAERMVRFEPVTDVVADPPVRIVPVCTLYWPDQGAMLDDGFHRGVDPVPKG